MVNMGDMEMSEMSSVSNESWGGVSNAESLHSAQFRMRSLPASIESQSKRFSALKTVLADQQALVEGMLEQVYGHLDDFQTASLVEDN